MAGLDRAVLNRIDELFSADMVDQILDVAREHFERRRAADPRADLEEQLAGITAEIER